MSDIARRGVPSAPTTQFTADIPIDGVPMERRLPLAASIHCRDTD